MLHRRDNAESNEMIAEKNHTIEEAHTIWRISRQTIHRHIGAGNIRVVRYGRRVFIPFEEIQRVLKCGLRSIESQLPTPAMQTA